MLYLLFLGFLVSFLGQLPLGNMSFTATQVGLQEGITTCLAIRDRGGYR
jgi:hypothetical protein